MDGNFLDGMTDSELTGGLLTGDSAGCETSVAPFVFVFAGLEFVETPFVTPLFSPASLAGLKLVEVD
jgi:hypothetical protein